MRIYMRKIICLVFVAVVFNFNFAGDSFANPCENDLKRYCADVQPGGGRIMNCLKDHYKDVSQECYEAMQSKLGGDNPQAAGNQQNALAGSCKEDAEHYCSDVQPGGGRIVNCLQDHYKE